MLCFFTSICSSLVYPHYTLVSHSAFDTGNVAKNVTADSFLHVSNKAYQKNNETSQMVRQNKRSLGFITPWNDVGYNLTLEYCNKFSDIVPVWLRVEYENGMFKIKGDDVINEKWISEIKSKCSNIKIVPRLLLNFNQDIFVYQFRDLVKLLKINLKKLLDNYNFDGVFIECPTLFISRQSIQQVVNLVKEIRKIKKNILMIDIPSKQKYNYDDKTSNVIKEIINVVDYAFISAYELMEQALSPISAYYNINNWINSINAKLLRKIIVGIPFFGFDYSAMDRNYIFGADVINILEKYKVSIKLAENIEEHLGFYHNGTHSKVFYYPTLYFLQERLKFTLEEGFAGVGFWEVAQGLPCFFDIL